MRNTLHEILQQWIDIGAPEHVLNWLSNVVKFPLSGGIDGFEFTNKNFLPKSRSLFDRSYLTLFSLVLLKNVIINPYVFRR